MDLAPNVSPCSTAGVLNNALLLAGTALSMCAGRLAPMLVGRALAGLGCGAASVLVPRYLAETAPLAIRGALGTLTQVCGAAQGAAAFCRCLGGCRCRSWRRMTAPACSATSKNPTLTPRLSKPPSTPLPTAPACTGVHQRGDPCCLPHRLPLRSWGSYRAAAGARGGMVVRLRTGPPLLLPVFPGHPSPA